MVVAAFASPDQALTVAVDDTLFHRYGRTVFGVAWQHDGSAKGRDGIGRGNCFVIAGLVVTVPFTDRKVSLPVLFRLHQPKVDGSKPEQARHLVDLLAGAFSDRQVHVVADNAYRSRTWRTVPGNVTFTTRLAHNAAVYAPAPPRTGKRGRPAVKGPKLGTPADLAASATWTEATVTCYGQIATVQLAVITGLWHGSLGQLPVQVVLVRTTASAKPYDIALVSTQLSATPATIVQRYADRWSIEQSIKDGKDLLGVGQAHNRLPAAVARTVPFMMLTLTILTLWYHHAGTRRRRRPHPPRPRPLVPAQASYCRLGHADRLPPQPNYRGHPWPHRTPPKRSRAPHQAHHRRITGGNFSHMLSRYFAALVPSAVRWW